MNAKKIILPNLPYVFIALYGTKIGQAVRLAPGNDFSAKALNIMLNEFVEKVLIHERDIKGCQDSPQTIEIYFNFIGKFRTPDSTVPLTAEEQIKDEALLAEKAALREKRRLAYQKRRDNGKDAAYQREYQARVRGKKIAAKEAIGAEDRANGIYYLPNQHYTRQEGAQAL